MKIGFLVPHLGVSHQSFRLIHNINEVTTNVVDPDIMVFYENLVRPCYPLKFATSNIADAWNYSGNLITTTLSSAYKSIRFPAPSNKYFYVFNLEWIKMPNKLYENLAEVYQNPNLKLLARSQEHANLIEEAWARPVRAVIKDFNIDALAKVIKEDENETGKNQKIL